MGVEPALGASSTEVNYVYRCGYLKDHEGNSQAQHCSGKRKRKRKRKRKKKKKKRKKKRKKKGVS